MRMIDADALKYRRKEFGGYDDVPMEERKKGILYLLKEDIDDALTIDPVKHGKWVETGDKGGRNYACNCCRFSFIMDTCMGEPMWNYCPNCGASMKEEYE